MPIQRPDPIDGIDLPAQPQDPPTLDDVVQAKFYQAQVDVAFASQREDAPDAAAAANADVYKSSIVMAHAAAALGGAGAPPWFQPAIMAAMQAALAPIRADIMIIRSDIAKLNGSDPKPSTS